MFRSEEQAAGYLAGLIDGEGCVTCAVRRGLLERSVRVVNTSRDIIDACLNACERLGIETSLRKRMPAGNRRLTLWEVYIGRGSNLEVLARKVALQDRGKQHRLLLAASPPDSLVKRSARTEEAQRLRREGASHAEIAAQLGCSRSTSLRDAGGLRRGRKLAAEDASDIRALLDEGWLQSDIAKAFGVSDPLVSMIKNGRAWAAGVAEHAQGLKFELEAALGGPV